MLAGAGELEGPSQRSPSSGPKATLFSGLPICPQAPRWPQGSRGSMSFRVWGKINRGPRAAVIQIPCFPTGPNQSAQYLFWGCDNLLLWGRTCPPPRAVALLSFHHKSRPEDGACPEASPLTSNMSRAFAEETLPHRSRHSGFVGWLLAITEHLRSTGPIGRVMNTRTREFRYKPELPHAGCF